MIGDISKSAFLFLVLLIVVGIAFVDTRVSSNLSGLVLCPIIIGIAFPKVLGGDRRWLFSTVGAFVSLLAFCIAVLSRGGL
jgi:hypothetical protein